MQAFRNAAKPVVYLITITFLSWMILDLSGITGKGGGFLSQTSVGSVNGEPVDVRAYQAAVQNATTQRQQATGGTMSLEETDQVRNEVWDNFIETTVINDQIKKNHITTSPDEITEWIKNIPTTEIQSLPEFQTAGKFDLGKYQRWLSGPVGQQYVPTMEAQSRQQILRNKLFAAVTADVFLSDAALWQKYRDQNERVTISLTPIIGKNIIPDSAVTISTAEIGSYYLAHTRDFLRPKTAFMSFVAVPRRLDASDSAAALEHVKAVRAAIVGGELFADVAKRESADTATASKGGDLGEVSKDSAKFDPALVKAMFSLPVNTVSEPVWTGLGYQLVEVTKRTSDKKTGDRVTGRRILIPIELAGAHRAKVDAETDSLQSLAAERLIPEALDTVARALKLPIGSTGPVASGTRVTLGAYVIPDAGVWAFQAKVGETSPVIDGEVASYVFRVDSVQQAGVPPLVQIHDAVASKLREQKKEEKAKAVAEDLIRRVKGGASLADAAKALKLPNREFDPFTRTSPPLASPQIVGAAFGLPLGALSGVLDTPEGLYVIRVLQHTPADSAAFAKNKDQLRSEMIRSVRQERVTEYLADLRASAKIVDRRNDILKTNAETEAAQAAQQGKTSP
ncbi:MAG: peptidyl-prolyl cis-trans isomerase [Gemmatimonadales bacterium]